jgi:hypothetical protein
VESGDPSFRPHGLCHPSAHCSSRASSSLCPPGRGFALDSYAIGRGRARGKCPPSCFGIVAGQQ